MTTPMPMPAAGSDPNDFSDREPDRVREQTETDLGPAAADEDIDSADARHRLESDHEHEPNATDPEFDPDQDAPG